MPAYRPADERWHEKVDTSGDCWLWTAYRDNKGYGTFWVGGATRTVKAHRFGYELLVGPIPDGLQLDHLCRVRHCVNPTHLEPVTSQENTLRGETLAAANVLKTACPDGHPYDAANTYTAPSGKRFCRVCGNRRTADYRRRLDLRCAA